MGIFDALNAACVSAFMDREDDRGLVTIQKAAGGPIVTVSAIYDANFYAADGGEEPTVDLVTTISIRTKDFPTVAPDDKVEARGKSYVVREKRPDGEGMTILELELA